MKAKATIVLETNIADVEVLKKEYTKTIASIIASQLSLQEVNELIEKLMIT